MYILQRDMHLRASRAQNGTFTIMNNKKFPWIIAICAVVVVVVGIASFVAYSYNDVSDKISTASQGAYVMSVGNSFSELLEDVRFSDPSFLPTKITDDQLADYVSDAKEKAANPASGPVDADTANGIRAVTFSQREDNSFQLISGDGSASATMTLYDDAAMASYYVMDAAKGD